MGLPTMAGQMKTEIMSIDFGQILSWSKDWAEMQDSWGFITNMMAEIPEEFSSCSVIVQEIVEAVQYTIANLSIHDVWAKF